MGRRTCLTTEYQKTKDGLALLRVINTTARFLYRRTRLCCGSEVCNVVLIENGNLMNNSRACGRLCTMKMGLNVECCPQKPQREVMAEELIFNV